MISSHSMRPDFIGAITGTFNGDFYPRESTLPAAGIAFFTAIGAVDQLHSSIGR
jgi:hypothetical protein